MLEPTIPKNAEYYNWLLTGTYNVKFKFFTRKNGISKTLNPAAIVLGIPKIEFNNLKLEFGAHVQAHVKTRNDLKTRSIVAICLRPSSTQSGYYFMLLVTGKRVHTSTWTKLPIPNLVE